MNDLSRRPSAAGPALAAAAERIRAAPLANLSDLVGETAADADFIPLWFGEGDLAAPPFVGEALAAAVGAGEVFYTRQNGAPVLREALAAYLSGLGTRAVAAERITVTVGGMNAIMLALMTILESGDNIVVADPVWPNAAGMARLLGAQARPAAMRPGPDGWTLDLGAVEAAMDARTRAVFFASPGNPTGAIIPMETQRALLELTRARGAWLIADEVYNRLVFGRRSAPTLLDHADPEDRLFVVNSFSKSWAMTGWRLGWLVHPPSLSPTLAMMVQFTTSGVTTFLQHAGVAALERGEPFVAKVRDYCEAGATLAFEALTAMGRVRLGSRPQAGMYLFFEVDGMADSRAAAREIARRAGVGLAPGWYFGPHAEGWLRLCVARADQDLARAMARLAPLLS